VIIKGERVSDVTGRANGSADTSRNLPMVKLVSIQREGDSGSLVRVGQARDERTFTVSNDARQLVSDLRRPGTQVKLEVPASSILPRRCWRAASR